MARYDSYLIWTIRSLDHNLAPCTVSLHSSDRCERLEQYYTCDSRVQQLGVSIHLYHWNGLAAAAALHMNRAFAISMR